jgi:Ran GTPase-activating protein (RanGAP) involved in mRNA processing and transport
MTFSGRHFSERYSPKVTRVILDLRDIAVVDLSALAWCLDLEELNLRGNELQGIDLSPLRKCTNLRSLRLNHNNIHSIDLYPLNNCFEIRELALEHNQIESIDITPLFFCPYLKILTFDDDVGFEADTALREEGTNWSDALVEIYDKIEWRR